MSADTRHLRAADRQALRRDYVGDGVYVTDDGHGFWLTAEDGERATDAIYLEPYVLEEPWHFTARKMAP